MIVCHCNVIACAEIRSCVRRLAAGEEAGSITPGRVFRSRGAVLRCGGCISGVRRMIASELRGVSTLAANPVGGGGFGVDPTAEVSTHSRQEDHEGQSDR